jgi:hypothetical protein
LIRRAKARAKSTLAIDGDGSTKHARLLSNSTSDAACNNAATEADCPENCVWYVPSNIVGHAINASGVCRATLKNLRLVGNQSKERVNAYGDVLAWRPQVVTTERYNNDTSEWESCSGEPNCFFGSTIATEAKKNGPVLIANLTEAAYTTLAMEAQIKCEGAGVANFFIRCSKDTASGPINAQIRIWYNLQQIPFEVGQDCFPSAQWTEKYTPLRRSSSEPWRNKVRFPINEADAHPILRVEIARKDSNATASAMFNIMLTRVSAGYDKCMETKELHGQCLDELVGNMPLRSNHTLQQECLLTNASQSSSIDKCDEWRGCFNQSVGELLLLNVLNGLSMTSSGVLSQIGLLGSHADANCIDDPNHETCVNPTFFDVEAYDCNCFDSLKNKTAEQIHALACNDPAVCCDWKQNHCSSTGGLLQARRHGDSSSMRHLMNLKDLDSSVLGKTCSD